MNLLNKLFSGGTSKLVESVGGVLDNVITTDEEKKEAYLEGNLLLRDFEDNFKYESKN